MSHAPESEPPCTCDRKGAVYGANPDGHRSDCPAAPGADFYREKLKALLAARNSRDCVCPKQNPDCQHPTCPRFPQPGHYHAMVVAIHDLARREQHNGGLIDPVEVLRIVSL